MEDKNADKIKIIKRKKYLENREKIIKKSKLNFIKNYPTKKAIMYARSRAWAKAKPGYDAAKTAMRRNKQKRATPMWLNAAQIAEIDSYYEFCSIFKGFNVDHIYPINSKIVSGLHVPWNLQILTESENKSKLNKMPSFVALYIERPILRINDDGTCETEFIE